VLDVVEARGDYGENETGNVLYDIDDRRLGHLISAPRPPSLATSLAHILHEDRYGPWKPTSVAPEKAETEPARLAESTKTADASDEEGPRRSVRSLERVRALATAGAPTGSVEQRRRQSRHRIMRILLDDPVLYLDALSAAERDYLRATIGQLSGWAEETGMHLERRAEGWALVDPDGIATDVRFPEGNDQPKFAALLLLAALVPAAVPQVPVRHPRHAAELVIAARLRANPTWTRAFQDDDGAARLTAAALELLVALDLAVVDETAVTLLPAAGRYRPEVADAPTGAPADGPTPNLFDAHEVTG
jgi:uncharacterized protein (TIGR02678 family)